MGNKDVGDQRDEFFNGAIYVVDVHDPSQMREALCWSLFQQAGVPAPRHTYARLGINGSYLGLFSVVEHIDRSFLKSRFGERSRGNLYKAGCGDLGGA